MTKCRELTDEADNQKVKKPFEAFFKRVLQFAAIRVSEITLCLNICDEIRELIWSVVQIALSKETHMMFNRHLDQIIISTVYGMCRIHHLTLKMNPKF